MIPWVGSTRVCLCDASDMQCRIRGNGQEGPAVDLCLAVRVMIEQRHEVTADFHGEACHLSRTTRCNKLQRDSSSFETHGNHVAGVRHFVHTGNLA
jgi:hypothetical protein